MNQLMGVVETTDEQTCENERWRGVIPYPLDFIDTFTAERVSNRMPPNGVQTIALARYILALNAARADVAGMFSEHEVRRLLHPFDGPLLVTKLDAGLADYYYEHFRYDNDDQHGPLARDSMEFKLCEKLNALTRLQQLAVIDIIECAVDNPSPLEYAFKHLSAPKEEVVTG